MVPAEFANFFLATAGAGGALIGLLFVAISINPDRIFGAEAALERQLVASGAFTALVDAFFTSCAALIPGESLASVAIIMSIIGLVNTARIGTQLVRHQLRSHREGFRDIALSIARGAVLVLASAVIYIFQLFTGLHLTRNPASVDDINTFCTLILGIYGLGLIRAWELLGAPRSGLLAFLNPLTNLHEDHPTPTAPSTAATADTDHPAKKAPHTHQPTKSQRD